MEANDLQDRASKLLRALEDGDAQRARDMLHGEDALDVALTLARSITMRHGALWTVPNTLAEVLAIPAAERMARETLARAVENPNVLPLGALGPNHARSHACAYGRFSGEGYNRVRVCSCGAEDHAPDVKREAEIAHSRAVANLYASDEDVEARR